MLNKYYYYFDLPKIRVGWARTTKKLSCLRLSKLFSFINLYSTFSLDVLYRLSIMKSIKFRANNDL